MQDGARPSSEIPVAEPTDEPPGRGLSDARRRVAIGLVVVVCLVAAAIPVTVRLRANDDAQPNHTAKRFVNTKRARIEVGAALAATIAARSYRITSVLSETAPAGSVARGPTFRSVATVNVAPLAMFATSDVAGLHVSSWTDGTRQWELGGGNYGLTSPDGIGPGQSISGFAPLVTGTLGRREGGVAMMGLASPNGHLDLTAQSITSAVPAGTSTINGAPITEYDVKVDAAQLVHQPGMTPEQVQAAADGYRLLEQEGYSGTTERLGIDDAGYLRESNTVWHFADGGTVAADTTFSDYGCAGTVVLPTQAPAPPPAPTCTSPDPEATTPLTTASTTLPTIVPLKGAVTPTTAGHGSKVQVFSDAESAITYAYAHFFDPALTPDQRAALIQGSAGMRDFIDGSFDRHAGEAAAGAVVVDHLTVHGDSADVSFHAMYAGGVSPANPGQLSGTAVLEAGTWKISRDTYCTLSGNDGEVCPPAA